MRLISLKIACLASFIMHMGLLSLSPLVLRQRSFDIPSSYTVSLVSLDEIKMHGERGIHTLNETPNEASKAIANAAAKEKTKITNPDAEYLEDRIAVLKGIKKIEQKVKEKAVISLSRQTSDTQKGSVPDGFSLRLQSAIEAVWFFPGEDKGLEAVISIKIMKNGIIEIRKVKQPSGNPIFDNSVLKAIKKVSPFEPPPYEMLIEVRTKPSS